MPGSIPKIIIAGAPASGKGTQCEFITEEFGVVHLSTGDMLRKAIKDNTVIGRSAKVFMNSGNLIPDHLVIDLVLDRIAEEDCVKQGWILDGFPRTAAQAKALVKENIKPDIFIDLDVPDHILVDRVVGRRNDPETGKIYHMTFSPPENDEIKARLIQREDDSEEKVKVRIKGYHENMAAVALAFKDQSAKIDGNRTPVSIWPDIRSAIYRSLKYKCVFVLGGPGSGKGTQCTRISEMFGYDHLSTGDLLREELSKGGPLAEEINDCITQGKLVSDDIVVKLLKNAMEKSDNMKFLIDGFPRSFDNLKAWHEVLGDLTSIDFILHFDCPVELMRERIITRGKASSRSDDNEETIIKRFETFQLESVPVLDYLYLTGKVRTLSSVPPPIKVFDQVKFLFEGLNRVNTYQRTLALIKPDAIAAERVPEILEAIDGVGLAVIGSKWLQLDDYTAGEFYLEHKDRPFYVKLKEFMSSGMIMALVLEGSDAIKRWRTLMGPTNSEIAREKFPNSLRGRFGTDGTCNATHGSDSDSSANREINFFFGNGNGVAKETEPPTVDLTGRDFCVMNTFAMIKPNASETNADEIKSIVMAHGFIIESEIKLTLTKSVAEKFYAEHEGREFFERLIKFMTSGPIIGMHLSRVSAIYAWRHLMGPTNLKRCRETRSDSIRALYAADGTRNAVHGSDSVESATRELQFFFSVAGEAPTVFPQESQVLMSKRIIPPPEPLPHWEQPPPSAAFKKKLPPLLSMRDHGRMGVYLRNQVDPVVRGLIQRALVNQPKNMLDWAVEDLAEQKRSGVGVKLPPMDGVGAAIDEDEDPLPGTLSSAHDEIRKLRRAVSAAQLSASMIDGVSMNDDDNSVATEGAIASGLNHFF